MTKPNPDEGPTVVDMLVEIADELIDRLLVLEGDEQQQAAVKALIAELEKQ